MKAVVACVGNFAAKGVRPRWASVSVTDPASCTSRTHKGMAAGPADAEARYGFAALGGDTTPLRGGGGTNTTGNPPSIPGLDRASTGDGVFATGPFGLPAAGRYAMRHEV